MRLDCLFFVAAGGSSANFCTVKYTPPKTAAPNNSVNNKPMPGPPSATSKSSPRTVASSTFPTRTVFGRLYLPSVNVLDSGRSPYESGASSLLRVGRLETNFPSTPGASTPASPSCCRNSEESCAGTKSSSSSSVDALTLKEVEALLEEDERLVDFNSERRICAWRVI